MVVHNIQLAEDSALGQGESRTETIVLYEVNLSDLVAHKINLKNVSAKAESSGLFSCPKTDDIERYHRWHWPAGTIEKLGNWSLICQFGKTSIEF